ncbi:hypothetical protein CsSME_00041112 [Camellia sinensis var. sinensis]
MDHDNPTLDTAERRHATAYQSSQRLFVEKDHRDHVIDSISLEIEDICAQLRKQMVPQGEPRKSGGAPLQQQKHTPPPPPQWKRSNYGPFHCERSRLILIHSEGASSRTDNLRENSRKRQKPVSHYSAISPPPRRRDKRPRDLRTWLNDNRKDDRRLIKVAERRLEREKEHLDRSVHQIEHRALDRLVSSPLCPEIEAVEAPHKYSPLKFILYDGKSDPLTHISHYR